MRSGDQVKPGTATNMITYVDILDVCTPYFDSRWSRTLVYLSLRTTDRI